jgi:hypothetical protein
MGEKKEKEKEEEMKKYFKDQPVGVVGVETRHLYLLNTQHCVTR